MPHTDRSAIDAQATDARGFLIPPVRSFSALYNLFSRTYSYRWDEAGRAGRANAQAMRRDAYLAALEQERVLPLTRWPWKVETDPDDVDLSNPKDPYANDREQVRRLLQVLVRRTPSPSQLLTTLGSAVFFGRSGAQLAWTQDVVAGEPRWVIRAWEPVHPDAIQYAWDGTPGITIRPGDTGAFPREDVKQWDGGTLLAMLRRPHLRQRFILHSHKREAADYWRPEMAGRSHGIGLRDYVYWAWWLRDEMLSWLTDYMEKVGSMGLLLFYYEDGNPTAEAAAKQAAADARGKSALAVPVPRGRDKNTAKVELIAAQTAGAQFLVDMVDRYFERHIERLYVGQSPSSRSEGSGVGGSGIAALHADTKFNLLAWDADNLADTLTRDLVGILHRLNFRDVRWRYRWAFRLPDADAKAKLDAPVKAANLPGDKLTFRADEVRALVGLTKPGSGDEIVGEEEPQRAATGDPVGYAQDSPHAPRGGIDLTGKHFLGGQYIPRGQGATVPIVAPVGAPPETDPRPQIAFKPGDVVQVLMPGTTVRQVKIQAGWEDPIAMIRQLYPGAFIHGVDDNPRHTPAFPATRERLKPFGDVTTPEERMAKAEAEKRRLEAIKQRNIERLAAGIAPRSLPDPAGPDVTAWFAKDIIAHIKYRKAVVDARIASDKETYKQLENSFSSSSDGKPGEVAGQILGDRIGNFTTDSVPFAPFLREPGFMYLAAPKWMDFGSPQEGKGVNTVVVHGQVLRRNILGNIEFGLIAAIPGLDVNRCRVKDSIFYIS
ncbi:phage portal protein family protein [Fimbriiglobus ruber]|uniref:Uncharacterized protein n=1 Tax=Fimbriiglobus ruber TaxID=1908690 RepID=A0A225DQM9_9BACT|nr:DUF935 family protein [Fimbriiglobus ruber]OWK43780.1 hypothetical protein FRUB_03379 [Fimbriiglobus ruber]